MWFWNHSYLSRKSCGEVERKKHPSSNAAHPIDDEEAIKLHLSELVRELKKSCPDEDKMVRLLSLTYASHRGDMMLETASTRIASA